MNDSINNTMNNSININSLVKMAFISRHSPTQSQKDLAQKAGYELIHVGDLDGFKFKVYSPLVLKDGQTIGQDSSHNFKAVAVVHAGLALKFIPHVPVALFENQLRPVEGGEPTFQTTSMVIYELVEYPDGSSPFMHETTIQL
jgi:hypothetical protein